MSSSSSSNYNLSSSLQQQQQLSPASAVVAKELSDGAECDTNLATNVAAANVDGDADADDDDDVCSGAVDADGLPKTPVKSKCKTAEVVSVLDLDAMPLESVIASSLVEYLGSTNSHSSSGPSAVSPSTSAQSAHSSASLRASAFASSSGSGFDGDDMSLSDLGDLRTPPRISPFASYQLMLSRLAAANLLPRLPFPPEFEKFEPDTRFDSDEEDEDWEAEEETTKDEEEEYDPNAPVQEHGGDWSDWDDPRKAYQEIPDAEDNEEYDEKDDDKDGEQTKTQKKRKEKTSEEMNEEEEKEKASQDNHNEEKSGSDSHTQSATASSSSSSSSSTSSTSSSSAASAMVDEEGSVDEDDEDDEDGDESHGFRIGSIYSLRDDRAQSMKPIKALYLGSYDAACNGKWLKETGITHILTVGVLMSPRYPDSYKYLIVQVDDLHSENLLSHFDRCHDFIDSSISSGGKCLVHCMAGISRSSTVVCSYLMKKLELPVLDALALIRRQRSFICPNGGFRRQLSFYQKKILKISEQTKNAKLLKTLENKKSVKRAMKFEHFSSMFA